MKIPIISFLLDEKHPWPPHLIDGFRGAASELGHLRAEGEEKPNTTSGPIQALRGELQAERVVGFFTEPADLEAKVSAAITVAGMSRQVVLNIAPEMSIALMEDSSMDGGIRRLATDAGPMQVVRIDLNTIWWSTRLFLAAYVAEALTNVRWFAIVTSEPDQQDGNPFIGLFQTAAILASTDHLPPEVRKFTSAAARAKRSVAGNETDVGNLLALWEKAFSATQEIGVQTQVEAHLLPRWYPGNIAMIPVHMESLKRAGVVDLIRLLDYPTDFVPVLERDPQEDIDGKPDARPALPVNRMRIVDKRKLNAQLATSYIQELRDRARIG